MLHTMAWRDIGLSHALLQLHWTIQKVASSVHLALSDAMFNPAQSCDSYSWMLECLWP